MVQISELKNKILVASFMGTRGFQMEIGSKEEGFIPCFTFPESTATAISKTCDYAEFLRRPKGTIPMLDNIDKNLHRHNFSTRTEFIRNAIRDKLDSLKKEELIEEFLRFNGKSQQKTSDSKLAKIRKKAFVELAREKGWD